MNNKRILIFNVNWLGDVLFSTAVLRNIRRNYPDSYIVCIIPSRCGLILEGNPNLDEVIIFDEKGKDKGIFAQLRFIRLLAGKKFDKVFLLHRSASRALICYLAGISERVGHYTKKRAFLLTKSIMPPDRDSLHRIDYYLNIIEQDGLKVYDRHTEFFFSEEDEKTVEKFLKDNAIIEKDFVVGVNLGGNWLPKRWPVSHWAMLIDRLIAELELKVIITGGDTDAVLVKEAQGLMEQQPIVASGVFGLKQFGALCKRLDLFITADTGPLHIANASGVKKVIALFGPTDPAITGPYPQEKTIILKKDIGCKIPCYKVDCKENRCMAAITPEEVLKQVKLIIAEKVYFDKPACRGDSNTHK